MKKTVLIIVILLVMSLLGQAQTVKTQYGLAQGTSENGL